jgi:hypothetical protein
MKKMIVSGVVAAAVALGAAGVSTAGTAKADGPETAYFSMTTADGFRIYDARWFLQTGYMICNDLTRMNGEQASEKLFGNSSWADVPDMYRARIWVVDAALTLCPWQYHPGSVV